MTASLVFVKHNDPVRFDGEHASPGGNESDLVQIMAVSDRTLERLNKFGRQTDGPRLSQKEMTPG